MHILVFAASSSKNSINKALAAHAAQRLVAEFLPDATVELLDLNDYEMPIFSVDREKADGIHPHAQHFFSKVGAADALLISYAEHNGAYTAAFKNVFDWASRIEARVFQNTPAVYLSTSPGGRGGLSVLTAALDSAPRYGAEVVASLSVPRFYDAFDNEQGTLKDAALAEELGAALSALATRLQTPPE